MSEATDEQILAVALPLLKASEGCELSAYQDTRGIWTIGYGHAYVAPGTVWTQDQADAQISEDAAAKLTALDAALPWWRSLDPIRCAVLLDMAFNLGVAGLCGFRNALAKAKAADYAGASAAMLLSAWASEVGDRAQRDAFMMRTGTLPARIAP